MQRRLTYKINTGRLMFGLLMVSATSADCDSEKSLLQYSHRLVAGQWNPWVLPEAAEKARGIQCPAEWQNEQTQGKSMDAQGQVQTPEFKKRLSGRFVTPGILESLKQQQIQTQMTPGNEPYRQLRPRQGMPRQGMPQQPVTRLPERNYYGKPSYGNYYGEPSYGMGTTNPLYDSPAVSPWGSAPDVIYHGGSFSGALPDSSPWVPKEAVGGLLPMPVSPYEGNSNRDELNSMNSNNAETDNIERQRDDNVFNPFTFVPNRGWR